MLGGHAESLYTVVNVYCESSYSRIGETGRKGSRDRSSLTGYTKLHFIQLRLSAHDASRHLSRSCVERTMHFNYRELKSKCSFSPRNNIIIIAILIYKIKNSARNYLEENL